MYVDVPGQPFFVMVFLAPIVRLSLLLIITKVKTIIVQLLYLNPTTVMVVLLLGLWLWLGCDNILTYDIHNWRFNAF